MCQILDYKIEMTRSTFRTLVQFKQADLHMTYTQTIGTSNFRFLTVIKGFSCNVHLVFLLIRTNQVLKFDNCLYLYIKCAVDQSQI